MRTAAAGAPLYFAITACLLGIWLLLLWTLRPRTDGSWLSGANRYVAAMICAAVTAAAFVLPVALRSAPDVAKIGGIAFMVLALSEAWRGWSMRAVGVSAVGVQLRDARLRSLVIPWERIDRVDLARQGPPWIALTLRCPVDVIVFVVEPSTAHALLAQAWDHLGGEALGSPIRDAAQAVARGRTVRSEPAATPTPTDDRS
jgi:hypothetical protein